MYLVKKARKAARDMDPTNKNSAVRKAGRNMDPTNKNSAVRKAGRDMDPTNPQSDAARIARNMDPFNKNSAVRKAARNIDPTNPQSDAARIARNMDPFNKNSAVAKALRNIDPTNPNSAVSESFRELERSTRKLLADVGHAWDKLDPDVKRAIIASIAIAAGVGAAYLLVQSGTVVTLGVCVGSPAAGGSVVVPIVTIGGGAGGTTVATYVTLASLCGIDTPPQEPAGSSSSSGSSSNTGSSSSTPPRTAFPPAPAPVASSVETLFNSGSAESRGAGSSLPAPSTSWSLGEMHMGPGGWTTVAGGPTLDVPFLGGANNYAKFSLTPDSIGVSAVTGGSEWGCSASAQSDILTNGIMVECSVREPVHTCDNSNVTASISADSTVYRAGDAVAVAVKSSRDVGASGQTCNITTTYEVHVGRNAAGATAAAATIAVTLYAAAPASVAALESVAGVAAASLAAASAQ